MFKVILTRGNFVHQIPFLKFAWKHNVISTAFMTVLFSVIISLPIMILGVLVDRLVIELPDSYIEYILFFSFFLSSIITIKDLTVEIIDWQYKVLMKQKYINYLEQKINQVDYQILLSAVEKKFDAENICKILDENPNDEYFDLTESEEEQLS